MKDLVIVNPDTGVRDNCGTIIEKRTIGDVTIHLTYDEPNRFWWICWNDGKSRKLGFIEARREVAWETFFALNEAGLAKLRDFVIGDQ